MSKINILVVPSDNKGGVGFYRSTQPHIQLEKQFPDDFSVTFEMNPNFRDLSYFDKFQIIHIHKGLFQDREGFLKALDYFNKKKIVTIMDIDDNWKLSPHHPMYESQRQYHTDDMVKENLSKFDYVTTTTELFENQIKPFNKNTHIFQNAIDPTDERFIVKKPTCGKLRVGMIMGSSHEYDVETCLNSISNLPKEIRDKIEFVLCGFDLRGKIKMINRQNGTFTERDIQPKESVWYRYEQMMTNNYKNVSPEYKNYLEMFVPNGEYPNAEQEGYRRCWTKDMNHYYQHYQNVDVLLAPLEINDFNKVKSPLKVAECAFSNTAIIASNFGPYTLDLKNIFVRGGEIDKTGNAILIDDRRSHSDWAKAITKLVKNPELVTLLQNNLRESVSEKFDLRNVTKERAKWYKEIVELKNNK